MPEYPDTGLIILSAHPCTDDVVVALEKCAAALDYDQKPLFLSLDELEAPQNDNLATADNVSMAPQDDLATPQNVSAAAQNGLTVTQNNLTTSQDNLTAPQAPQGNSATPQDDLALTIHKIDPWAVVAIDDKSIAALQRTFCKESKDLKPDQTACACGYTLVAVPDFAACLDNKQAKAKAWARLKAARHPGAAW